MRIYTVFDDKFIGMARSFINSHKYFSQVPLTASLPGGSDKSVQFCKKNNIDFLTTSLPYSSKQNSRILKMQCADIHNFEEPIAYLDADIVFQNDIQQIEDLNPNFLWTLSKREGHQTNLRKWKRHYFTSSKVEFAREHIPKLDDKIDVEEALLYPVRNCGVIYGNRYLLRKLFNQAKEYYLKLLEINKSRKIFSDSDQLCFVLSFVKLKDELPLKELPLKFNRMPYHQSYDYKDKSCFFIPDNVVLHLNRCKRLGAVLTDPWSSGIKPVVRVDPNTRSGIVIPMQTSSIAERALMKNLYSLAVSNKANVYRDEDVGFPIAKKIRELDKIRDKMKDERPAYDKGLFFMFNGFLFMIDHGEHVKNRSQWIIGKYVNPYQLAGIFIEQMDNNLDISKSKIPIIPLSYGAKKPELWIEQGVYHGIATSQPKKYSVHFIGDVSTNKSKRKSEFDIMSSIPDCKIENRGSSKRLDFNEYMRDMAASKIVWCPPGGRPKTHREVEAMCCGVAVLMSKQNIVENEELKPDYHYICIDSYATIKDKVQYYLDNPQELSHIAQNGRLWYERNSSDHARARHIHNQALKVIAKI